ncbi:MAG: GNAT family N-acetyltransferase [Cytophagia bacterium]|nr:GNAT family N-acetyltransferase [Cytophagia bacterium]
MSIAVTSIPVELVETSAMEEVNELTDLTWPNTKPSHFTSESRIQDFINRNPNKTCHFIYFEEGLIGYAESFPRLIKVDKQEFAVLGLGAVCVHPKFKGNGLGSLLVRAAFERVDKQEFVVALFQTGVPRFYEKLNCKAINNKIINSLGENPDNNPFWDPYVMIYPRQFIGFQSEIDLLGPGF